MFLLIPLKTSKDLPFFIRSSHQMCSVKKGVLKILFNSEENTCIEASLGKVLFHRFIKKYFVWTHLYNLAIHIF